MSRILQIPGRDPFQQSPVTPGPLGCNDAADPRTSKQLRLIGDSPGTLGCRDYAAPENLPGFKLKRAPLNLWASNGPVVSAANSEVSLPAVVEGIAFIDSGAHPAAPGFYSMFPREPILPNGHFQVNSTVALKGMTVIELLTSILQHKSKDILIVSHGTGGGLLIPLTSKTGHTLDITAMDVFAGKLPEFNLELGKHDIDALKDKVAQVKKMGLRLIVFRACHIGIAPDVLKKLKQFFNCSVVCGPTDLDGFGKIDVGPPTTNPKTWEQWLQHHPGAVVEFAPPNRFAWTDSYPSLMSAAIVESDKAINDWVSKHLPGASGSVSKVFPYHALASGNKIIFPGDSTYRDHLTQVG